MKCLDTDWDLTEGFSTWNPDSGRLLILPFSHLYLELIYFPPAILPHCFPPMLRLPQTDSGINAGNPFCSDEGALHLV